MKLIPRNIEKQSHGIGNDTINIKGNRSWVYYLFHINKIRKSNPGMIQDSCKSK
jgi:hypothetical protein